MEEEEGREYTENGKAGEGIMCGKGSEWMRMMIRNVTVVKQSYGNDSLMGDMREGKCREEHYVLHMNYQAHYVATQTVRYCWLI